jgi:hypothetical protein
MWWETIQIGEFRLIINNQKGQTWGGIKVYSWEKYNPPHPSGTVFTLIQE